MLSGTGLSQSRTLSGTALSQSQTLSRTALSQTNAVWDGTESKPNSVRDSIESKPCKHSLGQDWVKAKCCPGHCLVRPLTRKVLSTESSWALSGTVLSQSAVLYSAKSSPKEIYIEYLRVVSVANLRSNIWHDLTKQQLTQFYKN